MSIRRTIESLLSDEQQQEAFRSSPEAFFADNGMDEIPGELIGTAFVHYSDSAPIEHGDAVAGIATRHSSIPFEESDLPGYDPTTSDDVDPFATIGSLTSDTSDPDPDTSVDSELDVEDLQDASADIDQDDSLADDALADDTTVGDTAVDDSTVDEAANDNTMGDDPQVVDTPDDVSSDSYGAAGFDSGFEDGGSEANDFADDFNDGFDQLDDAGFGDGTSSAPTEILGEIHGGGQHDPGADDPFFDDVTSMPDTPAVETALDELEFGGTSHEAPTDEPGDLFETFSHEAVEAFDDIDPGDLDLDDF